MDFQSRSAFPSLRKIVPGLSFPALRLALNLISRGTVNEINDARNLCRVFETLLEIQKFSEEPRTGTRFLSRSQDVKNQRYPGLSFTERELIAYPITGNPPRWRSVLKTSVRAEGDARNHGVDLNERFYELHPAPSDIAAVPTHKVFLIWDGWRKVGQEGRRREFLFLFLVAASLRRRSRRTLIRW